MNPIPMPRQRFWLALAAALPLTLSGCLGEIGPDEQAKPLDADDTPQAKDEPPMRAVTTWSGELELFMEYPAPTAGKPGQFITHLTHLGDFSPVMSGPLLYRFVREDGHVEEHLAETVTRDGIFLPEIRIEKPGRYRLELLLGTGDDRLSIGGGQVDVTAPGGPGPRAKPHADAEGIAFLKEQQWRMDFAVRQISTDHISERLSVPARIEARPGHSAQAAAPASGMLITPETGEWKRPGERVEAGEVLARVLPLSGVEDVSLLDLDLTQARERLALARAERERVQSLYEDGVVSEKRLDEAKSEYRVARQALERAHTRLGQLEGERDQAQAAVTLRAPISGVITASPHAPGELIAANQAVFSLLDDSHVWLKAMAYPGDMARITHPGQPLVRQAGGSWQSLPGAKLVYTGSQAEENGTIPLVFDIPNPEGRLIPGTAWSATFPTGTGQTSVVIPKSAILDDDGIDVVIVQHDGERFERRQVKTGVRSGDRVAIAAGLKPGERVVTAGAYTVLLASRGDQDIGHGHGH